MLLLLSLPESIITHYYTYKHSQVCPLLILDIVDDQPFMIISLTMILVVFSWGLSFKSVEHVGIIQVVKVAKKELMHEPSTVVRIVHVLIQEMHHPGAHNVEVSNVAFKHLAPQSIWRPTR